MPTFLSAVVKISVCAFALYPKGVATYLLPSLSMTISAVVSWFAVIQPFPSTQNGCSGVTTNWTEGNPIPSKPNLVLISLASFNFSEAKTSGDQLPPHRLFPTKNRLPDHARPLRRSAQSAAD